MILKTMIHFQVQVDPLKKLVLLNNQASTLIKVKKEKVEHFLQF